MMKDTSNAAGEPRRIHALSRESLLGLLDTFIDADFGRVRLADDG
jgi:hypothetical protein